MGLAKWDLVYDTETKQLSVKADTDADVPETERIAVMTIIGQSFLRSAENALVELYKDEPQQQTQSAVQTAGEKSS
jgi:hypothetical protein